MIAVSEIWATETNTANLVIPGYKCQIKPRPNQRGGGVAMYVDETIGFSVCDDLKDYVTENFEFSCVQLDLLCGKNHYNSV